MATTREKQEDGFSTRAKVRAFTTTKHVTTWQLGRHSVAVGMCQCL